MNPALLNYLQSQGQDVTPQMGNNMPQSSFNPFDQGIRKAIESARESLGMTEKQQDKALRRSALTFANNIAQQPKERGFFNNFGAATRALSPAIAEHDLAEDESLKENNLLANQIIGHRRNEEARQMAMEDQAWRRQHAENQMTEQRRYHDLMGNRQPGGVNVNVQGPGVDVSEFITFPDKRSKVPYQKDQKALGTVLHEVDELEKNYNNFRNKYRQNISDPMGPFSGITNPTKDFFGKFTENKNLRQETADRKSLNSRLNKFVVTSERALKGGGVMGPTLIKLFQEQGIYPNLDEDTPEIFESKLKMLRDELANNYKAADLSLRYGIQLNPSNVAEFENKISYQPTEKNTEDLIENVPDANEIIIMQDQQGNIYEIPSNEAEEALNDGLIPSQ